MKTFFYSASDLITYVLTENTSMLSTFIRLSIFEFTGLQSNDFFVC